MIPQRQTRASQLQRILSSGGMRRASRCKAGMSGIHPAAMIFAAGHSQMPACPPGACLPLTLLYPAPDPTLLSIPSWYCIQQGVGFPPGFPTCALLHYIPAGQSQRSGVPTDTGSKVFQLSSPIRPHTHIASAAPQ